MNISLFVKCVGVACLLIAGYLFGSGGAGKLKQRSMLLAKLIDAFSYLRNKMCVGEYALPEAMAACDETFFAVDSSAQPDSLFRLASDNLTGGKMTAAQAWSDACAHCREARVLSGEIMEKLADSGILFDSPDRSMQQENLSRLIETLELLQSEALKKEKRDSSLIVKVSVAACGILAILLW